MAHAISRRHLKNGLFAFIDVLGFAARVESINTEQQLLDLAGDVAFVHETFEHKVPDALTRESHKSVDKKIQVFSDCLLLSVPLRSPLTALQGQFDILMSELHGIALAQATCVLRGIFLRGGVDLGFWYRHKDTLISPALVQAYRLEHDACVPMIAVAPKLLEYLSDHPLRRSYSQDLDPFPRTIAQYTKLPNGKAHWFINYLRLSFDTVEPVFVGDDKEQYRAATDTERARMWRKAFLKTCRELAKDHGRAILEAHKKAERDDVRAKYAWLADYHNAEVKAFFGRASASLLIKPM